VLGSLADGVEQTEHAMDRLMQNGKAKIESSHSLAFAAQFREVRKIDLNLPRFDSRFGLKMGVDSPGNDARESDVRRIVMGFQLDGHAPINGRDQQFAGGRRTARDARPVAKREETGSVKTQFPKA